MTSVKLNKVLATLRLQRLMAWGGRLADALVFSLPMIALSLAVLWCAWQTIQWFTPSAHYYRPFSSPVPEALAARVVGTHWFGVAPAEPVTETLDVAVLGVYAAKRDASDSFAIVQEGAQTRPVFPGETVVGPWKLERVTASGIIVRAGKQEQLVSLVSRNLPPAVQTLPTQNNPVDPHLLTNSEEGHSEPMVGE